MSGDSGRVIQIGRTVTLMSGHDYDYRRVGGSVLEHPTLDTDRIVAVNEKPHENLELAGLGDGEVDSYLQHSHGAPDISSKHRRTNAAPTSDSEFCVHYENHCFHHPAAYVTWPDCGVAPECAA